MRTPAPRYEEVTVDGVWMSIDELKDIIVKAAEYGANKNANLPDYYSLHKAGKIFGKSTVAEWISSKQVVLRQTGSHYRLRRQELEQAAMIDRRQIKRMPGKVLKRVSESGIGTTKCK